MVRFPAILLSLASAMLAAVSNPPGLTSTVFTPRQQVADAPRFSTLPPAETGIAMVNGYNDPRMWTDRYEEFAFGSIGTGIALADYDGDERPDIFLVGKSDASRLYRNLGGWRFEDVTQKAGLSDAGEVWKQGACFADVDNDGDLDLFVCRSGAANLLYLNQGDGTFREGAHAAGLDLVDASVMASFQDYDRDGWLDLYLQTSLFDPEKHPRGQPDHLYHNRGDGTFEEVTTTARIFAETQGHSATWWDANDDGWPDLYVANDFITPDQLYQNLGNGVFAEVIDAAVPYFPYFSMGADSGDVNNDGRLDFFVADMLPRSRHENLRGMANMQAKMALNLPPNAAAQYMRNMLYVSTGTGRFEEAAQMAGIGATDWTWSVRFEDLDEDGRLDLHVTNGMVRNFFDADFLARVGQAPPAERKLLVKAAPELRQHNLAFRNRGDLSFEEVGRAWGLDHLGISFGSALGDLDGDGDLDLVFANYQGEAVVCRNNSTENNHMVIALRGTASNRFGIGARVRVESRSAVQIRQIAIARGYLSSSEPIAHFGLGGDREISRLIVDWPSGRQQTFEKLEANRRYVITEPDEPTAAARREPPVAQFQEVSARIGLALPVKETPVNEFGSQPLLPWRQQSLGPSLAIGDADGDGLDDLVVGGVAGQPLRLLTHIGREFLPGGNPVLNRSADVADAGVLVFDANGDGQTDLLIAKGGVNRPAADQGYQPRLLFGRGGGFFDEAPADALPSLRISGGPVVAADFDHDGELDVFVGGRVVPDEYTATPRSVLLKNTHGQFADVTEQFAPGLASAGRVQAALWTDVDEDGWIDLLIATHWGGIQCWRNREGRGFEEASVKFGFHAAGSGWWNSIAAADFNGDGHLDYAVGNLGQNTRYHPTGTEPVALVGAVTELNGRPTIIEAATVEGKLVPLRARDSLVAAAPSLRSAVPTYAAYANAPVETIIGRDRLAAATQLTVTETRSGVFMSSTHAGGPRYAFRPLPRRAQLSPLMGIVAGDFDGDGRADLYGVQNLHTPHPEIGRFGGGVSVFLRGDGRGDFSCVSAAESGLLVPGEARSVVLSDFNADGWPDFVVSRQDASLLAFANRPIAGRHSFTVRLTASGANPSAIGARVTVVSPTGQTQVSEVAGGSGYLGQSSTDVFFGYQNEDVPSELRVHWPDGSVSMHAFDATKSIVRIRAPAK